MSHDADRLAMLEKRIRQLEEGGRRRSERGPAWCRGPRGAAVVIGLALALVLAPAIALAAHQFGDVPNSNPFHNDIAALVNSGVTAGCGGGNYCPKAEVTREQMAAFLNRLGALAPDKTPVVNAAKLGGRTANELVRVARGSTSATVLLSSTMVGHGSVSITAPAAGFVLVTATPTVFGHSCTVNCYVTHRIKHLQTGAVSPQAHQDAGSGALSYGSAPVTWVEQVGAGTHTFESELGFIGSGTLHASFNALSALYTPFGGTGGGTLALDDAALHEPTRLSTE